MPEPVLNDICLELVPLVAGLSIAKAGGSGPPGHLGRVGVGCPRLLRQFMHHGATDFLDFNNPRSSAVTTNVFDSEYVKLSGDTCILFICLHN